METYTRSRPEEFTATIIITSLLRIVRWESCSNERQPTSTFPRTVGQGRTGREAIEEIQRHSRGQRDLLLPRQGRGLRFPRPERCWKNYDCGDSGMSASPDGWPGESARLRCEQTLGPGRDPEENRRSSPRFQCDRSPNGPGEHRLFRRHVRSST